VQRRSGASRLAPTTEFMSSHTAPGPAPIRSRSARAARWRARVTGSKGTSNQRPDRRSTVCSPMSVAEEAAASANAGEITVIGPPVSIMATNITGRNGGPTGTTARRTGCGRKPRPSPKSVFGYSQASAKPEGDRLPGSGAHLIPLPISVIVFGSFARGDADAQRDLDVIMVRSGDVDEDDALWRSAAETWRQNAQRLTGNRVEVIEVHEHEVGRLFHSGQPLWTDVQADGIVVFGTGLTELTARALARHRAIDGSIPRTAPMPGVMPRRRPVGPRRLRPTGRGG
jgi:hypothetical protein